MPVGAPTVLSDETWTGAPDLVVEIISSGSLRRDRYDKRGLYARFGVKEFWLADVANRSIEVLCRRGIE